MVAIRRLADVALKVHARPDVSLYRSLGRCYYTAISAVLRRARTSDQSQRGFECLVLRSIFGVRGRFPIASTVGVKSSACLMGSAERVSSDVVD